MLGWAADWSSIINSSILLLCILSLSSLAGYFCNKVGIVNIALEGQMIFGALIFCIFAQVLQPVANGTYILSMLLAVIFSVLLSWLFGFLIIKIKCDHTIASTAINLSVAGLATFLTGPLGSALSHGNFSKLNPNYSFEFHISGSLFADIFIILAIVAVIIFGLWFLIEKTRFGLRFKAVGDNPNAVDAQGLNVNKYKWIGMLIAGVLTALAGAIFSYGGSNVGGSSEFNGNVAGLGFLALGIVVAGAWKIPFIIVASIIFAILVRLFENEKLVSKIFNDSTLNGLKYVARAFPFILSLIALAIFSRKSVAPQALGIHFDKTSR